MTLIRGAAVLAGEMNRGVRKYDFDKETAH